MDAGFRAPRWLAATGIAVPLSMLGPAHAASPAESFVEQATANITAFLADRSLNDADRRSRAEDAMNATLDLKRMALFTLGPAAKTASSGDVDAFVAAYRGFAMAMYEAELGAYAGQTVSVTGVTERAPGDFIVNAVVNDPKDKSDTPAQVSFRVLDEGGGKLALVDASIEGVWFTLAQRDDFSGFLQQNGGDIAKLAEHLRKMAANAAAPPSPDVGQ